MQNDFETSDDYSFLFESKGKVIMKIDSNGDFYVKGNLVTCDKEVYEGFKSWLAAVKD